MMILSQRSGRYYTREEFPPRSWIEGGIGTAGENNLPEGDGGSGLTFCAPMMMSAACTKDKSKQPNAMWSEQDWQGQPMQDLRYFMLKSWKSILTSNGAEAVDRIIDEKTEIFQSKFLMWRMFVECDVLLEEWRACGLMAIDGNY
ncbi:hypothetical protein B0J14DRAFT_564656 [Halenospora varia]|nr:hypothetical protein B0J14DRAFT_564656 [Halenospora varia]